MYRAASASLWCLITSQWPNTVLVSYRITGSQDLTTIALQSGTQLCRNWGNVGKICNFGSHSLQSRKAESWTVGESNRWTKQAREISAKVATVADNWYRCLVHILWTLQVRNSWLSPHTFCLTEKARYLLPVDIRLDHGQDEGKTGVRFPAESIDILFSKTPGQYLRPDEPPVQRWALPRVRQLRRENFQANNIWR